LAVLGGWLVQTVLLTDSFVYAMFKWHLNGYVWNLLTTPGGIESMEMGSHATWCFGLVIVGILAFQVALMVVAARWKRLGRFAKRSLSRRRVLVTAGTIFLLALLQMFVYAISEFQGYRPVLRAAGVFPFYMPVTMKGLGRSLGLKPNRDPGIHIATDESSIHYPLASLHSRDDAPRYNVVMLVAESWRADMVTPEIMPRTYEFAEHVQWYRHHYSGGHDTRMALFSLFYGLHGTYWFGFLNESRGPVLMDVLLDRGYQTFVHSSMAFTYPEFDRTIFARLPAEKLHTISHGGPTWQRDRQNIDQMLTAMDGRDPSRPFFAFMFFDSPHARYYFPPENAIRKPYLDELNYATMNLSRDADLIKNRYINACNHMDGQIARVLDYLKEQNLLDSTIVVIAGDHGEEFMEKGHWGHASGYPEEQTRTPLILHIPGRTAAEVNRLTSHLDIAPTLLRFLGVTNQADDYSLGMDLLGEKQHDFVVACGWDSLAYIDARYKAILSTKAYGVGQEKVTTADDCELDDPSPFLNSHKASLAGILRELARFRQ